MNKMRENTTTEGWTERKGHWCEITRKLSPNLVRYPYRYIWTQTDTDRQTAKIQMASRCLVDRERETHTETKSQTDRCLSMVL